MSKVMALFKRVLLILLRFLKKNKTKTDDQFLNEF